MNLKIDFYKVFKLLESYGKTDFLNMVTVWVMI